MWKNITRLFASTLNNGKSSPIEIDAASNSGVDNVRQIIQSAQERSIDGKYKIFIIDETHALSSQVGGFLKGIRNPQNNIYLFSAHKIPNNIVQYKDLISQLPIIIKDRLVHLQE